MRKNLMIFTAAIFLMAIVLGTGATGTAFGAETRYLKSNVHFQQYTGRGGKVGYRASYANWTDPGVGHRILPVNSEVTISVTSRGFRGRALLIIDQKEGRDIYFEFNERNMRMGIEEYIDIISSTKKTSLKSLSQVDRKGIKAGKVYKGMTKKGVQMALGYPARHRTPSLENDEWIYWIDRYRMTSVRFNSKGIVISTR